MRRNLSLAACLCLLVNCAFSVSARPIQLWSPNELWKKADLVVMATAETSQDAYKIENPKADSWVPVLSKFDVQAVLKGNIKKIEASGKMLVTVRHYRYHDKMSEVAVVDGPAFVTFNPKRQNRYLVFLTRKPDGTYEPLSGQYDPWQSFLLTEEYKKSKEQAD